MLLTKKKKKKRVFEPEKPGKSSAKSGHKSEFLTKNSMDSPATARFGKNASSENTTEKMPDAFSNAIICRLECPAVETKQHHVHFAPTTAPVLRFPASRPPPRAPVLRFLAVGTETHRISRLCVCGPWIPMNLCPQCQEKKHWCP